MAYRLKKMQQTAHNSDWETTEPFASTLKGDLQKALTAGGDDHVLSNLKKLIGATHGHISSDDFDAAVRDWLANDRHPTTGKPFNEMIYQRMLELLAYLRAHDFKTFIVSGGGIDLMRVLQRRCLWHSTRTSDWIQFTFKTIRSSTAHRRLSNYPT